MLKLMLSLGLVNLLGAMSPGPDFAIVVHQTLKAGRQAGLWTALGIATALVVHMSYAFFGLSLLVTQSAWLMQCIYLMGSVYLMYLGACALSVKQPAASHEMKSETVEMVRPLAAFRAGIFTNVLNPKAMLFISSMVSVVLSYHLSELDNILIAFALILIALLWFFALVFLITHPKLYHHFLRYQLQITRVMGVVLFSFGLFLLFLPV
jgi:threonine/homoserine/homoserine lactone efflux protein